MSLKQSSEWAQERKSGRSRSARNPASGSQTSCLRLIPFDNYVMRFINVTATATHPFIIVVALLLLVACGPNHPAEIKPDSAIATNPHTDSKPILEKALLAGLIEHVSMYPVPNRPADLAVSLVVSVGNTGSPSTAQGWSLEVTSPERASTTAPAVHVNGQVEMPGSNGKKVDLAKEDLVLKTAQVPIAKGARMNGILTFVLPNTSESVLGNNNTSLTVHFKDSQGNPYQTPKSLIGAKAAK